MATFLRHRWLRFGRDECGVVGVLFAIAFVPISGALLAAVDVGLVGIRSLEVSEVVDTACSRVNGAYFASASPADRRDAAIEVLDRMLPQTDLDMTGARVEAVDLGAGLVVNVDGDLRSLLGAAVSASKVDLSVNCDQAAGGAGRSPTIVFFEGFESPTVAENGYNRWYIEPYLPNWDLVEGSGAQILESDALTQLDAFEGYQYAELDSDDWRGALPGRPSNSAIMRTVPLTVGRYRLTYYYHRNHFTRPPDDQAIAVYVDPDDGSPLYGNLVQSTDQSSGWIERNVEFDVSWDGDHRITFQATGAANDLGGYLDAISLTRL